MSGQFDGDFAVGTVTGVRSWQWQTDLAMRGAYGATWSGRTMTATCGRPSERRCSKGDVPGESCMCGIYAYWDLACVDCYRRLRTLANPPPRPDRAWDMAQLMDLGDFMRGKVPPSYYTAAPAPPEPDVRAIRLLEGLAVQGHSRTTGCAAGWVHGVIEGYGQTIVGTTGFRCQKARIVALTIPPVTLASYDALANQLLAADIMRTKFGVPVYTEVMDMLDAHPRTTEYREVLKW